MLSAHLYGIKFKGILDLIYLEEIVKTVKNPTPENI